MRATTALCRSVSSRTANTSFREAHALSELISCPILSSSPIGEVHTTGLHRSSLAPRECQTNVLASVRGTSQHEPAWVRRYGEGSQRWSSGGAEVVNICQLSITHIHEGGQKIKEEEVESPPEGDVIHPIVSIPNTYWNPEYIAAISVSVDPIPLHLSDFVGVCYFIPPTRITIMIVHVLFRVSIPHNIEWSSANIPVDIYHPRKIPKQNKTEIQQLKTNQKSYTQILSKVQIL